MGIGWVENNALGDSRFDRERRLEDPVESHMLATRVEEVNKPCVELPFGAIDREFGEKGGMPDCIKCSRYIWSGGPDLMSDIHCWESSSCLSKVE